MYSNDMHLRVKMNIIIYLNVVSKTEVTIAIFKEVLYNFKLNKNGENVKIASEMPVPHSPGK